MFRALQHILREKKRVLGPAIVNGFSSSSSASDFQRLAGKVAVITGGASGIGKATAFEFVRNGAKVIIADVQDDLGRAVAAELGAGAACYARCDVADEAQVAAAVDLAVERHGRLDVMFNNAGIAGDVSAAPLASIDLAAFDRVMAVNARGALAGVKHAARVMVPRRAGSIICTASVAGVLGNVGPAAYSVSKAAVVGLVRAAAAELGRAAAAELGRAGVRVNAISPHAIPTPLGMGTMAEWLPREERRGAQADPRGHERDGRAGAGGGGHREGGAVPGVRRGQVRERAQPHGLMVDGGYTVSKAPNMPAP